MAGGIPTPWHCQPHGAAEPPLHPAAPVPCVSVLRAELDQQLPPPGPAVAAGWGREGWSGEGPGQPLSLPGRGPSPCSAAPRSPSCSAEQTESGAGARNAGDSWCSGRDPGCSPSPGLSPTALPGAALLPRPATRVLLPRCPGKLSSALNALSASSAKPPQPCALRSAAGQPSSRRSGLCGASVGEPHPSRTPQLHTGREAGLPPAPHPPSPCSAPHRWHTRASPFAYVLTRRSVGAAVRIFSWWKSRQHILPRAARRSVCVHPQSTAAVSTNHRRCGWLLLTA